MTIERRWELYRAGEVGRALDLAADGTAADSLYRAVLAFGAGERGRAAEYARAASQADPGSLVCHHAACYLAGLIGAAEGGTDVYGMADGFAAFIRGGGNLPLYAATSLALREAAERRAVRGPFTLLEIGTGDGRALLEALHPAIAGLEAVEPSAALLDQLRPALAQSAIPHRLWNRTIQEFAAEHDRRWDAAQATFSLQSLPPADLAATLGWLRAHVGELLIVEFDDIEFAEPYAPARVASITGRYERGLAEYDADRDLVAQGFLMPVMFGAFDQSAARTNYERPIAEWVALLRAAGFSQVETSRLYDYWWAPAYCLIAS